jgi:hypothetical protein
MANGPIHIELKAVAPILDDACLKILEANEIAALPGHQPGFVDLYDCDGGYLLAVTTRIDASDLRTILNLHRARFNHGREAGRREAFAQLRTLIGAQAAEEPAA